MGPVTCKRCHNKAPDRFTPGWAEINEMNEPYRYLCPTCLKRAYEP